MDILGDLGRFGLSANDAKVYLAVFESGECAVGTIQRKTKLHRQLIYIASDSLVSKGLMTVKKQGGRRRFTASSPIVFNEIQEERSLATQDLVKSLTTFRKGAGFLGEARVLKGKREIASHYLDSVQNQPMKVPVDIIGINSDRFFAVFKEEEALFRRMEETRLARKIRWNVLLFSNHQKEIALNTQRGLVTCKVIAESLFAPMDIVLWKDHVSFLIYDQVPLVIDIPGNLISSGFKKYFSILWKRGEQIQAT